MYEELHPMQAITVSSVFIRSAYFNFFIFILFYYLGKTTRKAEIYQRYNVKGRCLFISTTQYNYIKPN